MDALSSECSSGCESGWTLYFDHSSSEDAAATRFKDGGDLKKPKFGKKGFDDDDEEEEERKRRRRICHGLRRVLRPSDPLRGCWHPRRGPRRSSSQPACTTPRSGTKGQGEDYQSLLDDTASSPAIITNHRGWNRKSGGTTNSNNTSIDCNQWFGRKDTKEWTSSEGRKELDLKRIGIKPRRKNVE
ncbi:hypothetical protein MLD38_004904 [Melastoma candidum]|uniref:Uncharacterized protein n=1 Tax=Melastoma candidum TaxID=119954 RepID=A0ACB9S767_9MYRT|nr:hypothetical protein MLD38_004904 [Melastoma candidum]